MVRFCVLSAAAMLTAACGSLGASSPAIVANMSVRDLSADDILFRPSGDDGANAIEDKAVFRTQADVDRFIRKHPLNLRFSGSNTTPLNLMPTFDFEKELGIAVLLPPQTNGSFGVRFTSIMDTGTEIVVKTTKYLPKPGTMSPANVVRPFHYVAIPKTDRPIRFAPTEEAIP